MIKDIMKTLEEYDIYHFDGRYQNFKGNFFVGKTIRVEIYHDIESEEPIYEEYSKKVYHEWLALCFLMFFNILDYRLLSSPNKIPLIKTIRSLVQPFSFGLKESKEFVEAMIDKNIIYDVNENFDFGSREYIVTPQGKILLSKLNNILPRNYTNHLIKLFAKCILLDEEPLLWKNNIVNKFVDLHFNFYNIYNKETNKIELKV